MTPEQSARIKGIIPHLQLRDIFLYESLLKRGEKNSEADSKTAAIEEMRLVEAAIVSAPENDSAQCLQVKVQLGLRVVPEVDASADESAEPLFTIEASFIVEYDVDADLDDDGVKDFANFNGVHNVWPFWRQHVFDTVQRARLPHIDVPLFSGNQK